MLHVLLDCAEPLAAEARLEPRDVELAIEARRARASVPQ